MCLHPKSVNNDLLNRPSFVHSNHCTFIQNCDYVSVDSKIITAETDFTILQLNIRGLSSIIEKLKSLLNDSFKGDTPDLILLCET